MAVVGQNSTSLRKKDLVTQKNTTVAYNPLCFQHKATAGDTGINLAQLSAPSEALVNGFIQPSVTRLGEASLKANAHSLKLISSVTGLLQPYISYVVSGNLTIRFIGFTALEGEIFTGYIDPVQTNGANLVDISAQPKTGTLAANTTDINVGEVFKVNLFPSQQVGQYQLEIDGVGQFRNSGNSSTVLDANYYEVDSGNGTGTLIRLNAAPTSDVSYKLIPIGSVYERPAGSALTVIEQQQGIINKLIEVVSDLSGLAETDITAAPTYPDLKAFGDRVLAMEANRARKDLSNTFTAMQLIPGRTDGTVVPTGYLGEQVVALNDSSLRTTGATQNTYLDMPSGSFVIQPGIWMLVAQATLQIDNVTGGTAGDGLIGYIAIRTSGNVLVAENAVATANLNLARAFGSAPVIGMINITAATTYKISAVLKTISGAVSVSGSMIRGDFTPTKVTAVRIG